MHRGWWGWDSPRPAHVPFWLKVGWWPISFLMATSCASGDCLVTTPTRWLTPAPALVSLPVGVWWLAVLLLLTYLVGVCSGLCLARLYHWTRGLHLPTWITWTSNGVYNRWCILVTHAVNFVKKRRLVSFAFSNYRNYSLRNTETSSPTNLRRRRLQTTPLRTSGPAPGLTGLSPLSEGPVTPLRDHHGSDGRRA